jgi:HSP20 family protein
MMMVYGKFALKEDKMSGLMRWNPVGEMQAMRHMMDRFFNDFNDAYVQESARSFANPVMDIIDHENEVVVQVELPGINPDDVNVEFKSGALTIAAEVNREELKEEESFTRRERYAGSYRRSLSLPNTLDVTQATANFENGLLTLSIPKKPDAQPLRIPVSVQNGSKS